MPLSTLNHQSAASDAKIPCILFVILSLRLHGKTRAASLVPDRIYPQNSTETECVFVDFQCQIRVVAGEKMFIDVGKTISQNVSIGAIEYASQTPHIVDQIALGATSERLNLVRFSH
jgi:hypothetical protein